MMAPMFSRSCKPFWSFPSRFGCLAVGGRRYKSGVIESDDPGELRKQMKHRENQPRPAGDSFVRTKPFTKKEKRAKYVRVIMKKWRGKYIIAGTTIMAKSGKQFQAANNVSFDVEANSIYAITSGIVKFTPAAFLSKIGGYIVSVEIEDPHYPIPELTEYQDYVFGKPKRRRQPKPYRTKPTS